MGKIDLSKDISLQSLKQIDFSRTLGKRKSTVVQKRGINLVQEEKMKRDPFRLTVSLIAAAALLLVFVWFGVFQPVRTMQLAESDYQDAHLSYESALASVRDYELIEGEYRSYAMDWLEGDASGRYVNVDREDIFRLIDRLEPKGKLNRVTVTGDVVTLVMSEVSLDQVNALITEIEAEPFVASCFLKQASSQEQKVTVTNYEGEEVEEDSYETVLFTILINLVAKEVPAK